MTDWDTLARELDAWQEAGLRPTFWWRDDDATKPTPSLKELIGMANKHVVPLFLAVIPSPAQSSLQRLLMNQPFVSVLQHGFSHHNYSPRGKPLSELAGQRPVNQMIKDIKKGQSKLRSMFPGTQLDVLVPPWGRISEELISALRPAGFTGLSMGGDTLSKSVPGLRRVDVHVDIVNWRTPVAKAHAIASRTVGFLGLRYPSYHEFVGLANAVDQVVQHLKRRRTGEVNTNTPTGLMTHHLAHDERCWEFIDSFLTRTCERPSVHWMNAEELFGVDDQP